MAVEALITAAETLLSLEMMLWIVVGILVGIVVGALPGLGPPLGMAILLPLTLPLPSEVAIILLISVYSGAMYGGSIAAILINTPGVSSSAATTFDGYPMSKAGQAATALAISATASSLAGILAVLVLLALSPVVIDLVLAVDSPERFLIALLGLAMIAVVVQGSMIKGILAGVAGLLVTTIGRSPTGVELRYTDSLALNDGISFVAVLIGVFAIAEMMKLAGQRGGIADETGDVGGRITTGIVAVIRRPITVIKSGLIGLFVGAVPGAGATVSNFVAYSEAVRSSDDDSTFGSGNETGVIASEASNNGTVAGSLVPAISFGIPGSSSTAVLIGGLLMHGMNPSPQMFDPAGNLPLTYTILLALIVGNLLILLIGLTVISKLDLLTRVDTDYIIPLVIVLSFLGTFALDLSYIDVVTVLVFGLIGFLMIRHNYSVIAFVLGVVLGDIAERNLEISMQLSGGSPMIFLDPFTYGWLSPALVVVICLIVLTPLVRWIHDQYKK